VFTVNLRVYLAYKQALIIKSKHLMLFFDNGCFDWTLRCDWILKFQSARAWDRSMLSSCGLKCSIFLLIILIHQ